MVADFWLLGGVEGSQGFVYARACVCMCVCLCGWGFEFSCLVKQRSAHGAAFGGCLGGRDFRGKSGRDLATYVGARDRTHLVLGSFFGRFLGVVRVRHWCCYPLTYH